MSCLQTIRVFNGHSNIGGLVFGVVGTDGTAELFDFAAATRFTLTFFVGDVETVIDTDDDAGVIAAGAGGGELEFDLGALGVPAGTYVADMVVYSPAYPSGYVMDADDGHTLILDVR